MSLAAAMLIWAGLQADALGEGADGPGVQAPERAPIFLRTPHDLPRAEAGAWDAYLRSEGLDAAREALGEAGLGHMAVAERAYLAGDYPRALTDLYAVLEDKADFPPGLMLLGTTYFRLRRYEDCRESLARFLVVAPDQLWRTQAYGHALYSLGDYPRARDHYRRVIDSTPEDPGPSPEALRGLALCHMRLGERQLALDLLEEVLTLRPDHPEAYVFRARILYDEERLEEALAAAERARELSPYEPQPWFLLMQVLFDLGRDEEAQAAEARWRELDRVAQEVRALEMRLRFQPGLYGLHLRLCELFASIGDVQRVRREFAQLLRARPDEVPEVELRILVLDTLLGLEDLEGAAVAAQALEQTCPDEVKAWKRLERYYGMLRDRVNQMRCHAEVQRLGAGG